MEKENQIAFKEWAAIVRALSEGKQILIVRKGGIREEGGEFTVEHNEFFLFPTFEHQKYEDLKPSARTYLEKVISEKPASNQIPVRYYAEVKSVIQLADERDLLRLDPYHVWSQTAMTQRFHFGQKKGLFVLAVRVYRLPETKLVPFQPGYGGCKSWVEFDSKLKTDGASPVLSDLEFKAQLHRLNFLFNQSPAS